MKKSKATTPANKRKINKKTPKPKSTTKTRSALETTLVPTDIRKPYKTRLINAYFNRAH